MTRACLISACGEPLLASFCIELLKKNAWDEFDTLYICFNNYAEAPTEAQAEFMARYINDPKIRIIYWPSQLGYGKPIAKMLAVCEEDLICLLEDDGFIVKPGFLDSAFKQIENDHVDALGSPRFSCGQEIAEALKLKYKLDYSGYGDKGPAYWPNFFFCKRTDLLKTDCDFGPHGFEKGETYKELNHTMKETEAGDTFVWTSIQLRFLSKYDPEQRKVVGLKIGEIPQNHSDPYDIDLFEKKEGKWAAPGPSYIHGGSLSTVKYLQGVTPPGMENEINKLEIESRVAWWCLIVESVTGYDEYKQKTAVGILDLIRNAGLDNPRIGEKIRIYQSLL